jgi:signal transduction histidine kinase
MAYVILSPPFPEAGSASRVSMRLLYFVLDLFLVIRVFTLRMQSPSAYWRTAYGLFGICFVMRALNNVVTGSPNGGTAAIGGDPPVGPLWLALFVPLVLVARLAPDTDAEPEVESSSAARARLAPLVAYAFAFPVFHFLMERLGIVEDEMAGPREMVVLAFLGAAALLLWIYQRVLIRENERLEGERKLMAEEAAEARRMEGLGRLAGGVAHDFNNLLTVIRGRTELMLADHRHDPVAREDLEAIKSAARKGEEVTRQLLAFGRKQMLRPQVLDIGQVAREMAPLLRSAVSEEVKVSLVVRDPAPLTVADQGQVEMALLNLAVNAREAMPGGGILAIEVDRADLDAQAAAQIPDAKAGSYVLLTVRDTGRGMDESTLARIFEPFFTTKPFGTGAGLGLPAVHGFVKQSGGAIHVLSEPGRGATFRILLPRVDAAAIPADGSLPPEPGRITAGR